MRRYSTITWILLISCSGWLQAKPKPKSSDATEADLAVIKYVSARIDQLVEMQLKANDQQPNKLADDATIVRRLYLDLAGRIPTLEEARDFLTSKAKNKRAKLIDELLDSPAHVSHEYNYWADVLRIKTRLQGGNSGKAYIDFVKRAVAENKPYDQFVRELVASEGPALEPNNGATGYYLRDVGMPEDNMANTVRVFLGTRIECAQCHDHPFDKWTQRDFFEMVAFTGGLQTRLSPKGVNPGKLRQQLRNAKADAKVKQVAQQIARSLSYGVSGGGTGLARLPDSYQYDDGVPNEIVTAKTLFEDREIVHPEIPTFNSKKKQKRRGKGNQIRGAEDIDSREAFAEWLTSPENPRFSQVIANRQWKRLMGLALIEPLDDLSDETVASNEKLMNYLAEQMIELDFDLRQFKRAICNSKTYQREAFAEDVSDPAYYHFPGPLVRRMTAEQLWDSFVTLAVPEIDTRTDPRQNFSRYMAGVSPTEAYSKFKDFSVKQILELAEEQVELRNNPQKRREQFMSMAKERAPEEKFADEAKQLQQSLKGLQKLQKQARRKKNRPAVVALEKRMAQIRQRLKFMPTKQQRGLVRASELPSPAPVGHFLREFGQSDRDQIENANHEPAVTQILSLMNGQIERQIIANPRTVLMRNVVMAKSVTEKIDVVYLSMLGRKPTRAERKVWIEMGKDYGLEAANDLIWTLANSSEFMFVR